jgi:hypothetical protein
VANYKLTPHETKKKEKRKRGEIGEGVLKLMKKPAVCLFF